MSNFNEYAFFRNEEIDRDELEKTHTLITRYRDDFLENHALQNVLLNMGYELEQRPSSLNDILNAVILRSKSIFHLTFLQQMIKQAREPKIGIVSSPRILMLGQQEQESVKTQEGYDFFGVEEFQYQWMGDSHIRELVEQYKSKLEAALNEFNSQFILIRMYHSLNIFIPPESIFDSEREISEEINSALTQESYTALENAYYSKARELYLGTRPTWEKLRQDDFGKKFVLNELELAQAFKR